MFIVPPSTEIDVTAGKVMHLVRVLLHFHVPVFFLIGSNTIVLINFTKQLFYGSFTFLVYTEQTNPFGGSTHKPPTISLLESTTTSSSLASIHTKRGNHSRRGGKNCPERCELRVPTTPPTHNYTAIYTTFILPNVRGN